jgi:hypothetical protein
MLHCGIEQLPLLSNPLPDSCRQFRIGRIPHHTTALLFQK